MNIAGNPVKFGKDSAVLNNIIFISGYLKLKFNIDFGEALKVTDDEISELLTIVYVDGGYASKDIAEKIFEPVAVKGRGILLASRETSNMELAGMVIIVPPDSKSIVRAKANECEMHLLGVKPVYRKHGLGKSLITNVIDFAEKNKWSKIILWTQRSMLEAQRLYESFGFLKTEEMTKNGVAFFVYERECISQTR